MSYGLLAAPNLEQRPLEPQVTVSKLFLNAIARFNAMHEVSRVTAAGQLGVLGVVFVLAAAPPVWSQPFVEGFLEPIRSIDLASDESGAIASLEVSEGQQVRQGDVVARLDDRLQRLQVEMAEHWAGSTAAVETAQHAYSKRQQIAQRLAQLRAEGSASESEVIRAQMELAIARSRMLSAQEEAAARAIELRRAQAQLERRWIRAPFDAVVAKILAREGEFVSPLKPELVRLVQINQLLATFAIPIEYLNEIAVGDSVTVQVVGGGAVPGEVLSIGVETHAESGTVPVKVRVDNRQGLLRSGQSCQLYFLQPSR